LNEEINEQTILLKEILKWIKFTGMNQVKTILEKELKTDADKIVYQNSDGKHGTKELGNQVGVSHNTVHERWALWAKMGLGENIPVSGGTRFKRSFDLEEFGIKVPEVKITQAVVQVKQEEKQA
jgi:hypothetical protein